MNSRLVLRSRNGNRRSRRGRYNRYALQGENRNKATDPLGLTPSDNTNLASANLPTESNGGNQSASSPTASTGANPSNPTNVSLVDKIINFFANAIPIEEAVDKAVLALVTDSGTTVNPKGSGAVHADLGRPGGAAGANADFASIVVSASVVDKGNGVKVGKDSSNDTVVLYPASRSTGGPTISVADADGNIVIKFRY